MVTLIAFEALAVSTAMPVAARALGGLRAYGLAFSLFLTTSMFGMVLAGGWSDRSGPRTPILAGLGLFAVGLVVSGTATGFPALLVGRAVSGAGGGLEIVSLYVVVAATYPGAMQPRVFGAISAAWVLPAVIGPPLAGWLATGVSWRAVFLVVPPLLLLPVPALWPRLRRPEGAAAPTPSRDGSGRVVRGLGLAVGAAVLQWGLQGAGRLPGVVVAVAGGLLALACLPPLLPAGALRLSRGLGSVVMVRAIYSGTYFGAEAFLPLMLVTQRHLAPAVAGLALTAGAVGWAAGSWVQGRPGLALDRATLLLLGALVIGAGVALLAVTPAAVVPVWVAPLVWAAAGLGMGLAMSSTSVLTLRLSRPGEEGRNSSGLQIADALGSVLGIGLAGAVFAAGHDPAGSDAAVFAAMWIGLGSIGMLAALVARRTRLPVPVPVPG